MRREKVVIILSSKPNFDEYAFKYFILSLNKVQRQYEFVFPEVSKVFFSEEHYDTDVLFNEFPKKVQPNINLNYEPSYFINIINPSIGSNLFFACSGKVSFITTDTWEKTFSPPSLLEYLLHCIIASLIFMHPKLDRHSHRDTRGCYMDYTFFKKDDKVDISLGYLCDECKDEIIEKAGREYFDDISLVINHSWVGDINTHNTVAHNLKSYFKFDINKDSGFNKGFWERANDHFAEIPKEIIVLTIGALIGTVITLLVNKIWICCQQ
jgi:hypothetical protein